MSATQHDQVHVHPPPPLNILVAGSGIAGSTVAYWLLKAHPTAKITIIERNPSLRLNGAAVDIRSSAVDIIKWMNLRTSIREAGTGEDGMQFLNEDGSVLATLKSTGDTEMQTLTSEYEILRGTLNKVLIEPVQDRVQLVFNESVDTFEDLEDGIKVHFLNGKNSEKYDLLVAADGLGSKLRGQILGLPSRDQIIDQGIHIAYFTVPTDLLDGTKTAKGYSGTGGRAIWLRPDPYPHSPGRTSCLLACVYWPSDTTTRDQLQKTSKAGNDAYKALMREKYSTLKWELVPEILDYMDQADDFYCSIFGQVRSPILQKGRVVLLGDAGYATPGLGTSLAIMGAYVLAGELLPSRTTTGTLNEEQQQQEDVKEGKSKIDIPAALKRYEDFMTPLVNSNQRSLPAMQLLNPQTAWGITIRNLFLRIMLGLKIDKIAIYLAYKLGFKESKATLPAFDWPTSSTSNPNS